MSRKSVAFTRPQMPASADAWINQVREETAVRPPLEKKPTVRFTLDVDADLHTRMKIECVRQGKKMSDVLRAILAREFPAA
jgi:hypothetical protein